MQISALFQQVALNVILLAIVRLSAQVLGFPIKDRIALRFAAPQKTLALGIPFVLSLCESTPELVVGIITIPIIMYHPIQLIIASSLKDWKA